MHKRGIAQHFVMNVWLKKRMRQLLKGIICRVKVPHICSAHTTMVRQDKHTLCGSEQQHLMCVQHVRRSQDAQCRSRHRHGGPAAQWHCMTRQTAAHLLPRSPCVKQHQVCVCFSPPAQQAEFKPLCCRTFMFTNDKQHQV